MWFLKCLTTGNLPLPTIKLSLHLFLSNSLFPVGFIIKFPWDRNAFLALKSLWETTKCKAIIQWGKKWLHGLLVKTWLGWRTIRGGWQIDNERDGACTSVLSIIILLQIHAVACSLNLYNSLIQHIQSADFYRSSSLVSSLVGLDSFFMWEAQIIRLFTALVVKIYVFYRANSAGGKYCKAITCAGTPLEIANNSIYINTCCMTVFQTARKLYSSLVQKEKVSISCIYQCRHYSKYCCCIHHICQWVLWHTGNNFSLYLFIGELVDSQVLADMWQVLEKRNSEEEAKASWCQQVNVE